MLISVVAGYMTPALAKGLMQTLAGCYVIFHYVSKMENPYDDDDFD